MMRCGRRRKGSEMKHRLMLAIFSVSISTFVSAEPIGRWFSGFGQGTMEYGIKNDSAGSDYFYIACSPDFGTSISITVRGKDAPANQNVIVVIGSEEYDLFTDKNGDFSTESRVASDTFRSLWNSIRSGSAMRVRLQSGESTVFTLEGSGKVLDKEPCETDFER
jgi:hypothetical protein